MEKRSFCFWILSLFALCVLMLPDTSYGGIENGLISAWPMDEGSGTITQDAFGSNHGEIRGGAAWVTGKFGSALSFDGVGYYDDGNPDTDYVDCGSDASLKPTSAVTVSAWIKTEYYVYYGQIVGYMTDTGDNESGYGILTEDVGYLGAWITGSSGDGWYLWTIDVPPYPNTDWVHVALTYDGVAAESVLYVNGSLKAISNQSGDIDYEHVGNFLIGLYDDPIGDYWWPYEGLIDDVGLWDRALTKEEIDWLYNDGIGRPVPVPLLDFTPTNASTLVPRDQVLSWSLKEPMDVLGYDVYFGTDPNVAENPKVVDYELVNSFDPYGEEGLLEFGTTYYWRVDIYEPNDAGTFLNVGMDLMFTTIPSTPLFNPDLPANVLVEEGGDAVFVVEATNPVTMDNTGMTYAWHKTGDGTILSTTDTLVISGATLADEGSYYCTVTVTETGNSDNSREAVLVIKRELGHWPFDDTLEDVVGGNHGTYIGSGSEDYDTGVPGLGSALVFDGMENRAVTVPSTAVVSGFWSIAFWDFSPPDILNMGYMIASGSSSGFEDLMMRRWEDSWIGGLNRYVGAVGGITAEDESEDAFGYLGPYARDAWHHHVMTHDPITGVATWYIDGVMAGEYADAEFDTFAPEIYIGNRKSGERAFEGLIDDLWLYSYPLDPIEVAKLYTEISGTEICVEYPEYDFNQDCEVGIEDLAQFLQQWLDCGMYPAESCF